MSDSENLYHDDNLYQQPNHDKVVAGSGGCRNCSSCGSFHTYGENDEWCSCGCHYNDHY